MRRHTARYTALSQARLRNGVIMALDGIAIANITHELESLLANGRLYKIAQPEPDELLLTIKNNKSQYRLTISANAGLPLIYLTDSNKTSPLVAPNFCMLLRKHLGNARIMSVRQDRKSSCRERV